MRRVCHITTVHPATDARILHKECRSLRELGYDVTLIAPRAAEEVIEGVRIIPLPEDSSGRLARTALQPLRAYRLAVETDADLYHFHDPDFLPLAVRLARRGRPVIYDVHEDVPVQILHKDWMPAPLRAPVARAFAGVERRSISRLSAFVAVNDRIADRLRVHQRRGAVVTNYPRLDEIRPAAEWSSRRRAAGYVGSISRVRGARELVEAMSHCDGRLELGGRPSPPAVLDELRGLPGWERVDYRGDLDRPAVVDLLRRVMVGVIPLHPIRNYVDAYPVKLFEYMAAGIPVVATDVPRWRAVLEGHGCGVCVPHGSPRALGRAIAELLDDDERAEAMGRRGRAAVEASFSWDAQAENLRALYDQLLR